MTPNQGACTNLIGHVFETGANRSAQIATYTTSMEAIKNYVGINYDPHVLQSIKEMEDITPEEPELITPTKPNKVRGEEIKYGKKLDRHLSKMDKIKTQMNQVLSLFMGKMDDDTKHRLAEHK